MPKTASCSHICIQLASSLTVSDSLSQFLNIFEYDTAWCNLIVSGQTASMDKPTDCSLLFRASFQVECSEFTVYFNSLGTSQEQQQYKIQRSTYHPEQLGQIIRPTKQKLRNRNVDIVFPVNCVWNNGLQY